MITGMFLQETRHGLVVYTRFHNKYDPTIDLPKHMQTKERHRKTTVNDVIELTKMGYFTPTAEETE